MKIELLSSLFKIICIIGIFPLSIIAQIDNIYEDFEGNSNIPLWEPDDCGMDIDFMNPFKEGENTSDKVLKYQDTGGQYANVRFQMNQNFDLSKNQTFSLQIYVPSEGITGNQNIQVALKLQDGLLAEPWITQSEIIKPIVLNEWQTVTFDFENDNFINLDGSSVAPTLRTDFNRVVIQINGQNNSDEVLAYMDNIELFETEIIDPVFDKLIWSDEFDNDGGLDNQKWYFQTVLPEGNSWYNGEIQHYTDRIENTYIEDGILKMVAKKETFTDQGVTKEYTSSRLNSKFAFTYGRVEVRAKLPKGAGTWPAIWMLGKNIQEKGGYWETQGYGTTAWPQCGEIDIMEHWGTNQNYVSSALHTPSSFGGTINVGGQIIPDVSEAFHVYEMEWTEDYIKFSVDGITHYTYNPPIKNDDTWPFNKSQYILFNVAILPSINPNFIDSAMEIDYVRVYQQSEIVQTENHDDAKYVMYPNPFNDKIIIKTSTSYLQKELVPVQLYNSKGQLIIQTKLDCIDDKIILRDLQSLKSGIYFIRYYLDDKWIVQKLVKI